MTDHTTTRRTPPAAPAFRAASASSDGSRCPVVGNAGVLGAGKFAVSGTLRVRSAFGA